LSSNNLSLSLFFRYLFSKINEFAKSYSIELSLRLQPTVETK
jgi:hypothetical protein